VHVKASVSSMTAAAGMRREEGMLGLLVVLAVFKANSCAHRHTWPLSQHRCVVVLLLHVTPHAPTWPVGASQGLRTQTCSFMQPLLVSRPFKAARNVAHGTRLAYQQRCTRWLSLQAHLWSAVLAACWMTQLPPEQDGRPGTKNVDKAAPIHCYWLLYHLTSCPLQHGVPRRVKGSVFHYVTQGVSEAVRARMK
jgi:hypothetical protein